MTAVCTHDDCLETGTDLGCLQACGAEFTVSAEDVEAEDVDKLKRQVAKLVTQVCSHCTSMLRQHMALRNSGPCLFALHCASFAIPVTLHIGNACIHPCFDMTNGRAALCCLDGCIVHRNTQTMAQTCLHASTA